MKGKMMFKVEDGVLTGCRCESKLDVVVLPEGIKKLGAFSLKQFTCRKLVMPSTLEVIEFSAFDSADICEIDFGDCKLVYIGAFAFVRCNAQIECIPNSVRNICVHGAFDLKIGRGIKIKLPSSLRYIQNCAIDVSEISIVEADENLVTSQSGLFISILSSLQICLDRTWVQMMVFRKEQLVQEFIISCEFWRYAEETENFVWGNQLIKFRKCVDLTDEKGAKYQLYDTWFDNVRNKQCKLKMAFLRLKWPVDLSEDRKKKYTSYVNLDDLLKFSKCMPVTCAKRLEGTILLCHLEECLEDAMQKKDLVRIAYLMELINRNYGGNAKSLEL
ncbi:MAG: leucine-rich repeat domain-containing protein [Clostridiales bacterium]|nr:leucine-rich repeat domain-containing protein [Clostridiales bacterium]